MTDPIRDAAQALLDAFDNGCMLNGDMAALRAALAAPQPTADERVSLLMRRVHAYGAAVAGRCMGVAPEHVETGYFAAVESYARALLADGQEDQRKHLAATAALQARIAELEAKARHSEDCLEAAKERILELMPRIQNFAREVLALTGSRSEDSTKEQS